MNSLVLFSSVCNAIKQLEFYWRNSERHLLKVFILRFPLWFYWFIVSPPSADGITCAIRARRNQNPNGRGVRRVRVKKSCQRVVYCWVSLSGLPRKYPQRGGLHVVPPPPSTSPNVANTSSPRTIVSSLLIEFSVRRRLRETEQGECPCMDTVRGFITCKEGKLPQPAKF